MRGARQLRPHRGGRAVTALGFFLLVLGAKLWLIGAYGSPVPYWDQWGHEAHRVYKPYVEGRWTPGDLFQRANVHHVAWSRALVLGVLEVNDRQWDPRVQMVVQAALHAAFMTILAFVVAARVGHGALAVSLLLLGIFLTQPYAYANTLWGYQSHFYFLAFFSVLALVGLAPNGPRNGGFWLGLAAAGAALYTAASGFLAAAAAAGTAFLAAVTHRRPWRSALPTIAAGLAVAAIGVWMTQYEDTMGGDRFQNLKGESGALARAAALLSAAGANLGWPLFRPGVFGWILYAPLAVFLALWLRAGRARAAAPESERDARAGTIVVALGAWSFLSAVGISTLRGAEVGSRHLDVLVFGVWANALALVVLARGSLLSGGARRAAAAGAAAWTLAVAVGLAGSAARVWTDDLPDWKSNAREQLANVNRFLATDDTAHIHGKEHFAIPHPRPDFLIEVLRDPSVRGILPPVLRDPLPIEPAPESAGFAAGRLPEGLAPPRSAVPVAGSTAPGAPRFRSEPFTTRARALDLEVAGGGLAAGAVPALRIVDAADGTALRSVALAPLAPDRWRAVEIAVPPGERPLRLELEGGANGSHEGWLAFTAPKEVGPLGYRLLPLVAPAPSLAIAGAGLVLLGLGAWRLRAA